MDHHQSLMMEPRPPGMNCKPWYKDRLPSKYFARSKDRPTFPTSLCGRRWVFLKDGLDDFRWGCPPCSEMLTRGPKEGFLPIIYRTKAGPAPKSCGKKLPKNAPQFSKLSPAQLARKAFVEDVEAGLKEHPLAFHSHLDEALPVDLLQKVLEILDPNKQLKDTWAYCQEGKKRTKECAEPFKKRSSEIGPCPPKPTPMPKPEDWLQEIKSGNEDLPRVSAIEDQNLSKGITNFCNWVASIGCPGVDEEFILKQFEIDYSCNLKFGPSQIKKITQVDPEVKYTQGRSKCAQRKFSTRESDFEKKVQPWSPSQKKHVKMKYGAWYLHPKLWKKQREDEPLLDPKTPPAMEDSYFRSVDLEPDFLEEPYVIIAFKDFILSKGYSMPNLIEKLFTRKGWTYETTKIPAILRTKFSSDEASLKKD